MELANRNVDLRGFYQAVAFWVGNYCILSHHLFKINHANEYQACNGYNPTVAKFFGFKVLSLYIFGLVNGVCLIISRYNSAGATVCVSVYDYVADHLHKKLKQLLINIQIRSENSSNNVWHQTHGSLLSEMVNKKKREEN